MKLWYSRPAIEWNEALPLGNGKLGAMMHGGYFEEHIDLNETTLWSGLPRDDLNYQARRHLAPTRALLGQGRWRKAQDLIERHMLGHSPEAYQPLGSLRITALDAGKPIHYRRELDLGSGIYTVRSDVYTREAFVSHPDNVLAFRWTHEAGSVLPEVEIGPSSPHPVSCHAEGEAGFRISGRLPSRVLDNHLGDHPEPVLYEEGLGLHFHGVVWVVTDGGRTIPIYQGDACTGLRVSGASALTLLFTAASNFRGWNVQPDPADPEPLEHCRRVLDGAASQGWEVLKARHVQDYQQLYERVSLTLGDRSSADLPTDERLCAYRQGQPDPSLEALYFQYGRYLLIACSRPGGQTANLQGLWNPHVQPSWFSAYTININTQMNYWPAEVCALGECTEPLFDLLGTLAESGRRTARVHYGARGWTAHHNTDLWRKTTPTDGNASWAFWPLGGAWLSRQLWEGYLFRPDPVFLQERA
jgi:alpha-L-fucosidase 2